MAVIRATLTIALPILENHIDQAKRDLAIFERMTKAGHEIEAEFAHESEATVSIKKSIAK
jgi:hypothetical protein